MASRPARSTPANEAAAALVISAVMRIRAVLMPSAPAAARSAPTDSTWRPQRSWCSTRCPITPTTAVQISSDEIGPADPAPKTARKVSLRIGSD